MRIRLALKGRNKILDQDLFCPFRALLFSTPDPIPRAAPWAGMSVPLRGEIQEAQLQNFARGGKSAASSLFPPCEAGVNTVRPQSCSMLIIHEKPDSLLEGRCFQSRSRCRNVRPASIGLPGSAQQRTPRTEETKRSRARSVVLFQLLDVGLQFLPASQATKVELNHLQSPLRWLFSCPEADQQAGDDPQVDLDLNPIHVVGEQMTAAQDAFEPAEKQLHRPSIFVA